MEQKAPRSVPLRFTPRSCQFAKEFYESASDVVVYGMARRRLGATMVERVTLSCLFRPAGFAAGYMESPDPRDGAEGTEERVLELHTELLAKEIDESASNVVGASMVSQMMFPRDNIFGGQRSHVSLGQPPVKAGFLEKSFPRDGAEGTEERALALHTEELSVREGV